MKLENEDERALWRDIVVRVTSAGNNLRGAIEHADKAVEEYRRRVGTPPSQRHVRAAFEDAAGRIAAAASIAETHAMGATNARGKQWVIDQMVRVLLGDQYEEWRRRCDTNRPVGVRQWSEGEAPKSAAK